MCIRDRGYIPAGVLSFTIMVLPVAIGGVLMGTPAGLILGLTFGVTSFIKAPTAVSYTHLDVYKRQLLGEISLLSPG